MFDDETGGIRNDALCLHDIRLANHSRTDLAYWAVLLRWPYVTMAVFKTQVNRDMDMDVYIYTVYIYIYTVIIYIITYVHMCIYIYNHIYMYTV